MNIKILICFIIITSFPVTSYAATEKVWASKASGFIKPNELLAFQDYIVKVRASNNTTSTIMVFKDRIQLDTKTFEINEFKQYGDMGISLLGVYGDYSLISLSRQEDEEILIPSGSTILKWGDTFSFENYSISIESFGKDSVNLVVSGDNISRTDTFSKNDYEDYENLRILVADINRTGSVELVFLTYSIPDVKVEIFTAKEEYLPDENISVSINITGSQLINMLTAKLSADNSTHIQPDVFAASGINGTISFTSMIKDAPANSTINMEATIEWYDFNNNTYNTGMSKLINIYPIVSIIKQVPADTDEENVSVNLSIHNAGSKIALIHIHDNVYEEIDTKQLDWDIKLGPKNSTTLSYYISPENPGAYMLGTATAQWDGQLSASRKAEVSVHMPYISMVKIASNNETMTNVELEIMNIGDRPSIVTVNDTIPEGYTMAGGTTAWSGYLDAGRSMRLFYSLNGNPFSLPQANASYRDIQGVIKYAQSNIALNEEGSGTNDNEPPLTTRWNEILTFIILSFIVIFAIVGSFAFSVYLITRIRKRQN